MNGNVLLVDDEVYILNAVSRCLRGEPYRVAIAGSGEEALEILGSGNFKVVISDQRMPGLQGIEFLAQVRSRYPQIVCIMLTGHASLGTVTRATQESGVFRLIHKPWVDAELKQAVRDAIVKFDERAGLRGAIL